MATGNIATRLAKLEAHHAAQRPSRRVFQSTVRKGHEAEDGAIAFAELGMTPGPDDLTIRRAIVAKPGEAPGDWRPRAVGPKG